MPIIPFGTGTSLEGHVNAPQGGVSIDFRDMNRILAVHPEDLDCVIEPGVTRKQLNEYLRDQGLFFPIDPGADASLGGMAATRASGTNAVRYGTMKDNVLSMKVVLANGEVMTTATAREEIVASGYDLTRLMIGSEGTLGVITELTLKLYGIPEAISAGICPFPSVEAACNATILTIQSGIPVARIELLDALQVKAINAYSKLTLAGDAAAARRIPRLGGERRRTGGTLRRDRGRISAAVRSNGRPRPRTARGSGRRGMTAIGRQRGIAPGHGARLRPMCACRSRGWPNASPKPRPMRRRPGSSRRSSAMSATAISIVSLLVDMNDAERNEEGEAVPGTAGRARLAHGRHLHRRARRRAGQDQISFGGTRPGRRSASMRAIKQALDPHNIMNPGKMLPAVSRHAVMPGTGAGIQRLAGKARRDPVSPPDAERESRHRFAVKARQRDDAACGKLAVL